jgi:hypothetical protein
MELLALLAKCCNLLALAPFLHGALLLHHQAIIKNSLAVALGQNLLVLLLFMLSA